MKAKNLEKGINQTEKADHFFNPNVFAEDNKGISEEQFQLQAYMLANVSDAILATDRNFNIMFWNKAAERQYGWTSEEVFGSHFLSFIKPQYIGDSRSTVMHKIVKNGFWSGELIHNRRDGTLFPVLGTISEVKNNKGEIIGHVSINRDITDSKKVEEALMESEKKFRTVVEEANEIIYTVDRVGKFTYSNPAGLKSSGFTLNELNQKIFTDLVLPEYKKIVTMNYFRQFLKKEESSYIEYPFFTKSGEIKWYGQSARLIIENNNITGFFLIARDITDRVNAESALKESELKFRVLTETASSAIFIIRRDTIIYTNPATEILLGYSYEEIKNKNLWSIIHPDSKDIILYREIGNQGEEKLPNRSEIKIIRKDGEERWVDFTVGDIQFEGESAIIGTAIDITKRKGAEEELLKLSRAMEQSPASVIITNKEGEIEYVNEKFCEISGFSRNEVIGKNPRILKSGYHDKKFYEEFWNTIHSVKEWKGEILNKKKNGELFWESERISPMINNKGEITHIVAVKEDISEKKQMILELIDAKEKAQAADKLKSAFLANMSHEIRTPMNGILGFSELLKDPSLPDVDKVKYIQIINRSSNQLLTIINDIIGISKIEAGQEILNQEEFDLKILLDELIEFLKLQADLKHIELRSSLNQFDAGLTILADKVKLWQVLINLMGNAIKFTDTGSVSVDCIVEGEYLVFNIRDTGIGFKPQMQGLIFERFRQAESSTARNYGGTGLGLSISKAYAEMMGGSISVESIPGKGSTFKVRILYHQVNEVNGHFSKPRPQPLANVHDWSNKVFLLVEDDNDSAMLMIHTLSPTGVSMKHVNNGEEAVELCKKEPGILLILMDIGLPNMNGFETTKIIKTLRNDIPVIATTAYSLAGDRERCLQAGCDDYLPKPVSRDKLISMIKKYIK